ncbi:MAG: hypothetical protein M1824_002634 [Vezdaea acicularis]|nr:MAG: hypothetical protein M1824_002634 [Vezdaea acicularis]
MSDHQINAPMDQLGSGYYDHCITVQTNGMVQTSDLKLAAHRPAGTTNPSTGNPKKGSGISRPVVPKRTRGSKDEWRKVNAILLPRFERSSQKPLDLEHLRKETGKSPKQIENWYKKQRRKTRVRLDKGFDKYYLFSDEQKVGLAQTLHAALDFVKNCLDAIGNTFVKEHQDVLEKDYELQKYKGLCTRETLENIAKERGKDLKVVMIYWALRGQQDHDPLAVLHIKMLIDGNVLLNTPYDDAHFERSTHWHSGVTEPSHGDQEAQINFGLQSRLRIDPEGPFSAYNSQYATPPYPLSMTTADSTAPTGVSNLNLVPLSITDSVTSYSPSQYQPPFWPSDSTAVESTRTPHTEITAMSGPMSDPISDMMPSLPAQNYPFYECQPWGTCAESLYTALGGADETWYLICNVHGIVARH